MAPSRPHRWEFTVATFDLSNIAGAGFDMFGTDGSGWSFLVDDPYVEMVVVSDNDAWIEADIVGDPVVDGLQVSY
jgi:hypothetical protein